VASFAQSFGSPRKTLRQVSPRSGSERGASKKLPSTAAVRKMAAHEQEITQAKENGQPKNHSQ
jgi:hypothetical protein